MKARRSRHEEPWSDSPTDDGSRREGRRGERGPREEREPRGEHGRRGERRGERRGGRVRRGDIRELLLAGLLDGPAHGYELMSRLEQRTGGRWRPSPGSVYPMLQQLEDEGLVRGSDQSGRKVYELTDEGREQADEDRLNAFDQEGDFGRQRELRQELQLLALALKQVGVAGTDAQATEAVAILRATRQKLYALLAEE